MKAVVLQALCRIAALQHPDVSLHEAVATSLDDMISHLDNEYGNGDGRLSSNELLSLRQKYM